MLQMEQITDNARQKHTFVLPNGNKFIASIYYSDMQQGWFIESLSYLDFTVKGIRISNGVNLLRQYKNKIPFGLSCITDGGREPMLIGDFLSGTAILYVLGIDEVEQYEDYLRG